MNDLEKAIENLSDHSICLVEADDIIICDDHGIAPIMKLISDGKDVAGYSVADKIVGKAAAMLFKKLGIVSVYGLVMSKAAANFLEGVGISYRYRELVDTIINRKGTGMCPMESAVSDIDDVEEAYRSLKVKIEELRRS